MLSRRDFLRALGIGAATAAAPQILLVSEHEPIKRFYQVPAGAPVAHRDPHKALVEAAVRAHVLPQWRLLGDQDINSLRLYLASTHALTALGARAAFMGNDCLSKDMDAADDEKPLTGDQIRQIAEGVRCGDIEMKPLTLGRSGSWLCYGGFGKLELHIAPHLADGMKANAEDLLIGSGVAAGFFSGEFMRRTWQASQQQRSADEPEPGTLEFERQWGPAC